MRALKKKDKWAVNLCAYFFCILQQNSIYNRLIIKELDNYSTHTTVNAEKRVKNGQLTKLKSF